MRLRLCFFIAQSARANTFTRKLMYRVRIPTECKEFDVPYKHFSR